MKTLTPWSKIYLVLFLVLGPLSVAAQVLFQGTGTILSLKNDSININDAQYRVSPTVKIAFVNKPDENSRQENDISLTKGDMSQLKTGNFVQFTVIKINNRRYLDSITVLSENTPNKR